jgi:hypothetical protein
MFVVNAVGPWLERYGAGVTAMVRLYDCESLVRAKWPRWSRRSGGQIADECDTPMVHEPTGADQAPRYMSRTITNRLTVRV